MTAVAWPDNDPARPCAYRYQRPGFQCPNPVCYLVGDKWACADHLVEVINEAQDEAGGGDVEFVLRVRAFEAAPAEQGTWAPTTNPFVPERLVSLFSWRKRDRS